MLGDDVEERAGRRAGRAEGDARVASVREDSAEVTAARMHAAARHDETLAATEGQDHVARSDRARDTSGSGYGR